MAGGGELSLFEMLKGMFSETEGLKGLMGEKGLVGEAGLLETISKMKPQDLAKILESESSFKNFLNDESSLKNLSEGAREVLKTPAVIDALRNLADKAQRIPALLSEYEQYFKNAKNGAKDFQSWAGDLKNAKDGELARALCKNPEFLAFQNALQENAKLEAQLADRLKPKVKTPAKSPAPNPDVEAAQRAAAEAQQAAADAKKAAKNAAANSAAPGFKNAVASTVGKGVGKVVNTGALVTGGYFGGKALISHWLAATPPAPPANASPLYDNQGSRVKDKLGNDAFGQSQCDLPFVPLAEDLATNCKPGKDGKPQVIWNPAQEEPGMVNNFCKWIYEHTQSWDPTLQRIAFAAIPLVGAIIGTFSGGGGLTGILGIGMALLAAWQGPEYVASHANIAIQHDEWAKTHPAKPFNNAAAGTTEPKPQPLLSQGPLIPVPVPH